MFRWALIINTNFFLGDEDIKIKSAEVIREKSKNQKLSGECRLYVLPLTRNKRKRLKEATMWFGEKEFVTV